MSPFGTRYPAALQAALNHSQRLREVLAAREARMALDDPRAQWLIGRAGEVQCVVALVALDWHHERVTGEEAAARLGRYIRYLHDGMAMHLDIGSPSCCRLARARSRATSDCVTPVPLTPVFVDSSPGR
jgi:hypothetical protein